MLTYELLKAGKSLEEIATERGLSSITVNSHIAYLHENGYNVGIEKLVSKEEFVEIAKAWEAVGVDNLQLKPVFEYLQEKYPYDKIRLTKAIINRQVKA